MSELTNNIYKALDLLHKFLATWFVLLAIILFLPSEATSTTLKLPFGEVRVPHSFAYVIFGSGLFIVGVVCNIILYKAREAFQLLPVENDKLCVLTYPSIATLKYRGFSSIVVGYSAILQMALGAMPFVSPSGEVGSLAMMIGAAYAFPMLWLTFLIGRWDEVR